VKIQTSSEFIDEAPAISLARLTLFLLAILAGGMVATLFLPALIPGLAETAVGDQPTIFWMLSRGTAIVGFGLLWMSVVMGLLITNRLARLWPGGPAAFDLHQYLSILGLAFALLHGTLLLGDRYMNFSLLQVVVPFTTQSYRPVWVGIGQIAFYMWGILVLSFYVRKQISNGAWRLIHYASFLSFGMALAHGIASGTNSGEMWAQGMYWAAGGSLLFLTIYRILVTSSQKAKTPAVRSNGHRHEERVLERETIISPPRA
jgi:predicted ferric reductase